MMSDEEEEGSNTLIKGVEKDSEIKLKDTESKQHLQHSRRLIIQKLLFAQDITKSLVLDVRVPIHQQFLQL